MSGGGDGIDIPLPGMPPIGAGGRAQGPVLPTQTPSGVPLAEFDPGERTTAFREKAFAFLTGRPAGGALEGDRGAQLMAAFGASTRDPSRPNVAAAAKGLGVSTRSVQRWIAGSGMSAKHAKTLSTKARQAMTTKRGRAAAVRAGGALRPPRGKNGIKVTGVMGKISASDGNYRPREARVQVQQDDLDQLQALWVEHGDAGVEAFLHSHFDQHYEPDWHFRSVDALEWDFNLNYNDY